LEQEYERDADTDPTLESFAYGCLLFDSDSTRILNEEMPLELLKDAATRSVLPPHPRREIALATWVRAFLLGNCGWAGFVRMWPWMAVGGGGR